MKTDLPWCPTTKRTLTVLLIAVAMTALPTMVGATTSAHAAPPPSVVHTLASGGTAIFPGATSTWVTSNDATGDLYANVTGTRLRHCSLGPTKDESALAVTAFDNHLWTLAPSSTTSTSASIFQVSDYGVTSCTPLVTTTISIPSASASIDAFAVDSTTMWVASSPDGFNEDLYGFDRTSGSLNHMIPVGSTASTGQPGQIIEVGNSLWFSPSQECLLFAIALTTDTVTSTINLDGLDGGICNPYSAQVPLATDGTSLLVPQGKRLLALNADGSVGSVISNVSPASVTVDNGTLWIASTSIKSDVGTCAPLKKVTLSAPSSIVTVGCLDTTSLEPTVCASPCSSPLLIAASTGQLWVNTGIEFPLTLTKPSAPQNVSVTVSRSGVATVTWRAPASNPASVTDYHVFINGKEYTFFPLQTTGTKVTVNVGYLLNVGRRISLSVVPLTPLGAGPQSPKVSIPVGDPSGIYVAPPKSVMVGSSFLASATVYWNVQHGGPFTAPTPLGTVTFSANGHSCTATISVTKVAKTAGPMKYFDTASTAACSLPAPPSHGTFTMQAMYNGGPAEFSSQTFFYPSAPVTVSIKA